MKISFRRIAISFITCCFCVNVFAQDVSPLVIDIFNNGIAKQNSNDLYGASEAFQQVVQINPSYGEAWYHLSQISYELNDFDLALTYLEQAEKYARNRTDLLNLRGMTYISLGRLDDARNVFEGIIETYPNDIDARFGLAELNLFEGRYNTAQNLYLDALKRQNNNRKALLSLAVLSEELGNNDASEIYINQALKYHSGESEVHYLSAYLNAKKGNLVEAERRCRSAVQLYPDYVQAYSLLASIYFTQSRYDEVIDICDYLISKNRNNSPIWYLKGLAQLKKSDWQSCLSTWVTAISVNEQDELTRGALELLITQKLDVEDERRVHWSDYHYKKAKEYTKMFMGDEARYEFQRALRLYPLNHKARSDFAELLSKSGLTENYIYQLKFIQQAVVKGGDKLTKEHITINDTVEAYDSLMKHSLAAKWNVDPFYLDKTRWNIGIFYKKSNVQLVHCDAEEVAASMLADIFSVGANTTVSLYQQSVEGFGQAFTVARSKALDYFVLLSFDETEREVSMNITIYSGKTGTEITKYNVFRTGNDKFASVLRSVRQFINNFLPVKGKIIDRNVNDLLIDLGSVDGVIEGTVLDVVEASKIQILDNAPGVKFDKKNHLGKVTITRTSEEIAQGTLVQNGFYDKVNIGDEVLIFSQPSDEKTEQTQDLEPKKEKKSKSSKNKKITAEELGIVRVPAIVDLIRSIN